MYVKSVELVNIKGFDKLTFDFTRPDQTFHGWTVLVGGNASGKSTLLRAIALALVGPDDGRQLMVTPTGWLQINQSHGEVSLELSWDKTVDQFKTKGGLPGSTFMAGVKWTADEKGHTPEFRAIEHRHPTTGSKIRAPHRGPWDPNAPGWFCAGYGPMRRLSGSSSESMRYSTAAAGALSRFVTLFREDAALSESEVWLKLNHSRQLESRRPDLATLLSGVESLLGDGLLPHGMKISRITVDHVYIKDGRGIELPMRDISDGCRSIYATVLDLAHSMAEVYGTAGLFGPDAQGRVVVQKPGVVLIDEIEAHLHPKWQREIPDWLKIHFPKVQFIVSTHSPLVAQAADPNGVFVLPSQDDLGRAARQLDSHEYDLLRLRRAEKTLLGTAFGLKTTRSRWAQERIEKWKLLNAKAKSGAKLSTTEQTELAILKDQMVMAFEESPSTLAEEAAS